MAVAYAGGLMRGLKIMSIKDMKRTNFENSVCAKVFNGDPNVDAFFYSVYLKDKRKEETDTWKKEVVRLRKQIATNTMDSLKEKSKKKNKNKTKNVKK